MAIPTGLLRQFAPHGISWNGRWPTSATSAEEAYNMVARPTDPGFVSLPEVIEIQEHKKALLLDSRSTAEFMAGHIPGARHLPYYEMESKQVEALRGVQLNDALVVYCEGIGCELSFFLGRELQGQGYTNIKIFYGGYPEWSQAGLRVEK